MDWKTVGTAVGLSVLAVVVLEGLALNQIWDYRSAIPRRPAPAVAA